MQVSMVHDKTLNDDRYLFPIIDIECEFCGAWRSYELNLHSTLLELLIPYMKCPVCTKTTDKNFDDDAEDPIDNEQEM